MQIDFIDRDNSVLNSDGSTIKYAGVNLIGDLVTDEPKGYARARSARVRSFETVAAVKAEEWMQRRLANLTMDLFGTMSREAHKHTNIVQFFEAHHLISHIFLFIEDGGAFDLNQRLVYRVRDAQELPLSEVSSILRQCVDGPHHMHSVQSRTVM